MNLKRLVGLVGNVRRSAVGWVQSTCAPQPGAPSQVEPVLRKREVPAALRQALEAALGRLEEEAPSWWPEEPRGLWEMMAPRLRAHGTGFRDAFASSSDAVLTNEIFPDFVDWQGEVNCLVDEVRRLSDREAFLAAAPAVLSCIGEVEGLIREEVEDEELRADLLAGCSRCHSLLEHDEAAADDFVEAFLLWGEIQSIAPLADGEGDDVASDSAVPWVNPTRGRGPGGLLN